MKFKHNKKRNTAFLFEALVKELTKTTVESDATKKNQIVSLLKEFFSKNTTLGRELELYRSIVDCASVPRHIAKSILEEAKRQHKKLDQKDVFNKQSSLISKINKSLSKDVYNNFVKDYKDYANINQIVTESLNPQERVLLEETVIKRMTSQVEVQEEKFVPLDMLTYKTYISNFNKKYSDLNESQKTLLNKYIASFADNGLDFKIFLNEELHRLKEDISKAKNTQEDKSIAQKLDNVLGLITEFKNEKVNSVLLEKILKIQSLAKEVL